MEIMKELEYDRKRFKGVRVIPDVHGVYESFKRITDQAREEELFVLQLGDLLDRGPENGLTLQHMLDLEDEGRGTWVMGNHDWKHLRYFRGNKVQIKEYQNETIEHINQIEGLRERFVAAGDKVSFWLRLDDFWFAHAAIHEEMKHVPDDVDKDKLKFLRDRAIFGSVDPGTRIAVNGFPIPVFTWMQKLTGVDTIFLGHHSFDHNRIPICTHKDTKTMFLDGGCGKDNHNLRYTDLVRIGDTHVVRNTFDINMVTYNEFHREYCSFELV